MADLPIEKLLPRANYSIYKLVTMASMRALELSEGKRCLAENSTTEKYTTMALEEISQGKIWLKGPANGGAPKEKKQEETSREEKSE